MPPVCAIVVTYEPGPDLAANLATLLAAGAEVLVVDNGSSAAARARVEARRGERVALILNPDNRGIAAALNQGIAWAQARGFGWVGTFDQDSRVPGGYFEALLAVHAACPERDRVAVVCPRIRDRVIGSTHSFAHGQGRAPGPHAFVPMGITSGSLLPLAAGSGGTAVFREDFFIDYVDTEYCLRCRRQGGLILEAQDVVLEHQIGSPTRHRLLWMRPIVTNHNSRRLYYAMRNRLVLYREFCAFDPVWCLQDFWESFRRTGKMLVFERDRPAKLAAMARGLWHGLTGRMGPWRG